jgi:glycosyltransferase involved in cell wall biosynthesis
MSPDSGTNSQKILIVSGAKGDTRRYRTMHLNQQLRLMGVDSVLAHTADPKLDELAKQAAIVIIHRAPYDPYLARLIESVHENHGMALLDTDDLIFDPAAFEWIDSPDFRDPVRVSLYREDMRRHRQTLEACDAVMASTEYLAGRVRACGKLCWVHKNAANLELIDRSEKARQQRRAADGKIVIGYASGTPTHNRDFGVIAPVLREVMQAHPEIELRIIGFLDLGPERGFQERIRKYASVPWQELPDWLAQLDVNLAPLVEQNPFSQSKSEIKYMEAALVGVPTIASRTGSYAEAIRDGENGLLASEPQEWHAVLEKLMDPGFRSRLGRAAWKDTSERYATAGRARQALVLLNNISQASGKPYHWEEKLVGVEQRRKLWWTTELERHPTEIEMGLYTLRQRGAGTLVKQVWIYFRRWLARYIPYG